MFNWFGKSRKGERLGIMLAHDRVAGTVVRSTKGGGYQVKGMSFVRLESPDDSHAALERVMKDLNARNLPTYVVLNTDRYDLMQVEAPEVPADELNSAVRWRVKDMIDFHIDDAVIDVFPLPESRRPGAPKMMYVVVSRNSEIQDLVNILTDAGCELVSIDIVELALRNIVCSTIEGNRAKAFLYLIGGNHMINILQDNALYLSRRLSVSMTEDEMDASLLDSLALEIQRSMDYFESQYGQGSADEVLIAASTGSQVESIVSAASQFLTVPVHTVDVSQTLKGLPEEAELVMQCLAPLGGAMKVTA